MSREEYERGRVHFLMRGRPVTPSEIKIATGWPRRTVDMVLDRMRSLGIARRIGADGTWTRVIPPAAESGVRRLPMMVRGPGERRDDCTGYTECLGRVAKTAATSAHCPGDCPGYEAVSRDYHLAAATVRRNAQGAP